MVSNAAVAHHLVPEYDEAEVVHILHIVLLNIDPVLRDKREWGEKDIEYCVYVRSTMAQTDSITFI